MSELVVSVAQLRRRVRRRVPLLISVYLLVLLGVAVLAIFGSWIAPQQASELGLTDLSAHPSAAHWFGTDQLGRDVFSRMIVGTRTAVMGPLVVAIGSAVIGNALGLLAGYRGGWVDTLIMRWVDVMWSIPALLVVIVVAAAIGRSYWTAVGLLVILTAPFHARVLRGVTLEQVPRPYVEAAKTLGVSDTRIMFLHVWPNVASVAIANLFLAFASTLVVLSTLSFLGLGAAPGTPDWGLMLAENSPRLFINPVPVLAPGAMIALTATAMNLVGNWIYDQLSRRGATR